MDIEEVNIPIPQKETQKKNDDMEMPFPMQLEIYYDKFFPYDTFLRWLQCSSKDERNVLERREFSFTLEGDIYLRFLSFKDQDKLKQQMVSKKPIKIDIGAIYNAPPSQKNTLNSKEAFKPEEKEFIIDIDMNDYDIIRTCCKEARICPKCWKFLKLACTLLEKALTDDFGFEHILWVFSGRRGIHCWVSDPNAKDMKNDVRSSVIDYLSLIQGNKNSASQIKPKVLKKHLHPSVQRAIDIVKIKFEDIVLKDQDVFAKENESILTMVLNLIDQSHKDDLILKWNKEGDTSKRKWEIFCSLIDEKILEYTELKKKKVPSAGALKRYKYLKQEIYLTFLYPRLDAKVSTDIGHLLKSPFCIHPKTGKVCVPFKTENLNTFDPFTTPTINELIKAYDKSSHSSKDYEEKMKEYYDQFEDFTKKLELKSEKYLMEKRNRKQNENKIDF